LPLDLEMVYDRFLSFGELEGLGICSRGKSHDIPRRIPSISQSTIFPTYPLVN